VSGSGSFSARSTGSQPSGNSIARTLPLRAIQQNRTPNFEKGVDFRRIQKSPAFLDQVDFSQS
jgi:hypothetical protein